MGFAGSDFFYFFHLEIPSLALSVPFSVWEGLVKLRTVNLLVDTHDQTLVKFELEVTQRVYSHIDRVQTRIRETGK